MITTVKGKISKDFKGKVLAHEHISCTDNNYAKAFGKAWISKESLKDYAIDILIKLKEEFGVTMLVDGTPIDLGRDARLLEEVSEKSGVNIVASSGTYWFPGFADEFNSPSDMAKWFIKDCTLGMEDSEILPGILKCASGRYRVTDEIINRHKTMGIVQKETGLPIYVHSAHREDDAFIQTDILMKEGAKPEKIILGHTAIRPEEGYLERFLSKGLCISMDQCFCFQKKTDLFGEILHKLCEKGYGEKIILANDRCIHSDFPKREENGLELSLDTQVKRLAHVLTDIHDSFIKAGGREEAWCKMAGENVKNILDV